MDILTKLFGSPAIVKILRLFIFNEGEGFEGSDVARRTRATIEEVRSELRMLESIKLIKKKSFYKEVEKGRRKNKKIVKKRVKGFTLNPNFAYLQALRNFLINAAPLHENEIVKRLKTAGTLRLVIISGVFIQDWDSRVDILIVGDKIREKKLASAISSIESEIGRELRYAVFPTKEFKYRLNIYDKLVRDILDYPHQTVIDKLGSWHELIPQDSAAKTLKVSEETA